MHKTPRIPDRGRPRREDDYRDLPPARRRDRRRDDDEPRRGTNGPVVAIMVCVGIILTGTVVALVVSFAFAVGLSRPPAGAAGPVVTADLATVLKDWESNPVAVTERYAGQKVAVTGYVVEVGSNLKHQPYALVSAEPSDSAFRVKVMQVWLTDNRVLAKMKDFPKKSKARFVIAFDQPPDDRLRVRGVDVLAP
jgi:hypothetical protein